MTDLKPTDEQIAIIDATRAGGSSVLANAYAGCSKTTTLQMAGREIKEPALALAFNKKNAKDLEPRFGGNFSVKTLNSLGFGALRRAMPAISKWDLDDKKLGKLVSQVAKDRKVDLGGEQWDSLRRLVTWAMISGIVPGNRGRPLLPDTKDNWAEIADGLWISDEEFEFLFDLAHEVLERDVALVAQGIVSFDDQIYYPTCISGQFPKYPVLVLDEVQDFSPLNHAMVAQCARPGGRVLAVGDQKQSIYAFRGASHDSMERVKVLSSKWLELPLATTFRCPKVVVERSKGHAPGFRAWHTNAEGRFKRFAPTDGTIALQEGWTFADLQAELPSPTASLAILCRNNAPLLGMAFKLLRNGVGVMMLGRDIGKGLVALSRKLCPNDDMASDSCILAVNEWMERECGLARANGKEEKVAGITDRGECLIAALANSGVRNARELRQCLEKLFAREAGIVTLSTIHRAKGLEWDCVLHLDPWRIPSKHARKALAAGDASEMNQEMNMRYVAETRTKHTLLEGNLEDFSA